MRVKILAVMKKTIGFMAAILLAAPMLFVSPTATAQVASARSDFNHNKTGFPLTGAHARVQCETCHAGGVFKGTATDCAGCHTVGRRVVAPAKSNSHIITTASCETCHTNAVTFLGARYNHIGVLPKTCLTCHNGRTAPGKPNNHIATSLSCDSCHRTSSWLPAGFDHAPPLDNCDTCHKAGGKAKGVPANHVVVAPGQACDACHKSGFTTFLGAFFDHTSQNTTVCTTCHVAGTYGAKTKPTGHIPTGSANCDTCHVGTGYVSFAGSTMNHNAVTTIVCSTCHNGAYVSQKGTLGLGALPKNSGHIATGTKECGDCHLGRSSFLGGLFDHATASPAVAGRCNSCHDGIKALGKTNTATHNGTSAQCDTCHTNTQGYTTFAGAVFNHVNVANICGTCHLGQSAGVKTKTQNHIPTTGNACDSCHGTSNNYTSFVATGMTNAKIHNSSTWTTCLTCHNGSYVSQGTGIDATGARAMPNGHVSTSGAACSGCHATTAWLPAGFNHTGVVAGTCGTCHIPGTNGAKTKPAGTAHIPVSGNACDACHKSTALGGFATHTMNHTNVSTTPCATCHSATYAGLGVRVKPSGNGHIPTAITDPQDCKTCHTSTAAWTTETMNHNGIQGTTGITCITCHLSTAPYPGRMQKKRTDHTNGKDCSASGCHKPLGTRGTAYRSW